ncbi:efflux transporter outer membrane subunit [Novosphingobium sp.]|uniref:efflux transporter outer membrane subunit n=1 Tax=Novosphingobium sp. TaxID=1874826 RepID=UPI003341657C
MTGASARRRSGLGTLLLLGGCTVGPDFHTPAPPAATAYDREGTPAMVAPVGVAGGTQQWVDGRLRDGWWHAFGSVALDRLIDAGLRANTDLAATRAALAVARESWLASRGVMVPSVDVAAGSSRNKGSEYLSPALNATTFTYGLQTAQVTVGYNFDLFGLNRRTVEAARAQVDSAEWQTQGARISLINTLIAAAFADAAARAQVAAQERMIAIARETRDIVERQRASGQVSGADVLAQDTAVAQAEAGLPPLRRVAAQAHNLVAYLTGRSAADALPDAVDWNAIALPHDLPLTLPSALVRQRPDIRAAEANLHAASAGIGIAIANRLPQLTLSASAGGNSAGWSDLLSATRSFWSIGAGVTQPVFAGGALLHRQRAAHAAYDEADAQYRSAVLGAFRNVADTLAALRTDADGLRSAQAARDTAQASLAVSRRQYEAGATPFVAVLTAEAALRQAEQALVQAQLARLTDTAALFEALGGDWQSAAAAG